jgi:hypothetical protein
VKILGIQRKEEWENLEHTLEDETRVAREILLKREPQENSGPKRKKQGQQHPRKEHSIVVHLIHSSKYE